MNSFWDDDDDFFFRPVRVGRRGRQGQGQGQTRRDRDQQLIGGKTRDGSQSQSQSLVPQSTDNDEKSLSTWGNMDWSLPSISIKTDEKPTEYVVTADVPNFNKDQLNLEIKNGLLTISGEQREEMKGENHYSSSSRYVSRSVPVPENVREEDISAKYENGALMVILPKLEETKPKKKGNIQIQ